MLYCNKLNGKNPTIIWMEGHLFVTSFYKLIPIQKINSNSIKSDE